MTIKSSPTFIIFGASGWLGNYLVPALRMLSPSAEIFAIYRKTRPMHFDDRTRIISSPESLANLPSGTIINLNRGETEEDFTFHQDLISLQNQRGNRYLYASSFNAVDADVSAPHDEEQVASSQTPYGQFKAKCEKIMLENSQRPLIFRFAATHGWAPNREARTQIFLKQLSQGETIKVSPGIIQNRSFVGDLAIQIAMLAINDSLCGLFHLGAVDCSEEISFSRKLAQEFGYDSEKIIEDEVNDCNAVMLMNRFPQAFPDFILPTEDDTIKKIAAQKELAEFKKKPPY